MNERLLDIDEDDLQQWSQEINSVFTKNILRMIKLIHECKQNNFNVILLHFPPQIAEEFCD